jgi:hypothetical protein
MVAFLDMSEQPTAGQIFDALRDLRDAVAAGFAKVPTRDEMNAKFDAADVRFDRLERRVTILETRVDDGFRCVDERLSQVEQRLGKLESRRRR